MKIYQCLHPLVPVTVERVKNVDLHLIGKQFVTIDEIQGEVLAAELSATSSLWVKSGHTHWLRAKTNHQSNANFSNTTDTATLEANDQSQLQVYGQLENATLVQQGKATAHISRANNLLSDTPEGHGIYLKMPPQP